MDKPIRSFEVFKDLNRHKTKRCAVSFAILSYLIHYFQRPYMHTFKETWLI